MDKVIGSRKAFSYLAILAFHRYRSLAFCLTFSAVSIFAELAYKIPGLFSCSGAIFTIAGLFLNIKHSLHFHLKIPKRSIHYILTGAATFGSPMTEADEKKVDSVLADEMFGVAFMIIGTLIWAYGSYAMPAIAGVKCAA